MYIFQLLEIECGCWLEFIFVIIFDCMVLCFDSYVCFDLWVFVCFEVCVVVGGKWVKLVLCGVVLDGQEMELELFV